MVDLSMSHSLLSCGLRTMCEVKYFLYLSQFVTISGKYPLPLISDYIDRLCGIYR